MANQPHTEATRCVHERTGMTIAFADLFIGDPFYYMGIFWTKTDRNAGSDMRPRARPGEPPRHTFGICSFGTDEETRLVEEAIVRFE